MKRLAMVFATIAVLFLPAVASANSTCQQYSSQSCPVQSLTSSTTVGSTTTSRSTLPFTGLDVVLLLAGGGTLLGAGLVVRRLSRNADQN
ncbi:MAG: hypothetical protein ACRDL5_09775 [Solirubrobacteraceae bacterium]